jgi:uncharacterized protein YifN (PemK superfamily)
MPHSLRIYRLLKQGGFLEQQALVAAEVVELSRTYPSLYDQEEITNKLFDGGFADSQADALAAGLRYCFLSERFRASYQRTAIKTSIVRSGITAILAEVFLEAVDPCIVTARGAQVRRPIEHAPGAGHVVMCDFTFLRKPEMQKERRAIVISSRTSASVGRCTVVPVSMSEPREDNPYYHLFEPGTYPFFHSENPVWAVCDHVYTVSLTRLWQVNVAGKPRIPKLSENDLSSVRRIVGTMLGNHMLTAPESDATSIALAGGR